MMVEVKHTRVLFIHGVSDDVLEYLKSGLRGLEVEFLVPSEENGCEMNELLPKADILIGWGSNMDMLERAKKMKLFINPGTGIGQHIENFKSIDSSREVVLVNGHGNSYAVAQHTVALMMALSNKIISHHERMLKGEKRQSSPQTIYLKNKTVGFLGYGAINSKVHQFLKGFDIDFVVCRKNLITNSSSLGLREQYSVENLIEFFDASDIVINALPDTRETRELINQECFNALGSKGLFLNVGRGATVRQEDLYLSLRGGLIAGAAIEVWWERLREGDRPNPKRNDPYAFPFHELDNIVMSPHRGADSGGDLDRWNEVIENIQRYHRGSKDFLNRVDLEAEY